MINGFVRLFPDSEKIKMKIRYDKNFMLSPASKNIPRAFSPFAAPDMINIYVISVMPVTTESISA